MLSVNVEMDYFLRLPIPWAMTLSTVTVGSDRAVLSGNHADRDLGSPVFLHMQCLLSCRVKFIHIARFLSYVADGTESPILAFPGLCGDT